ncbi:MAG TPA: ribonuclease HIII [Anaerolinea thermolimosa]|uniref:Ribonuclease n=1 Tax=Anaerolinea thermolimosa TaxID=229919 RepID=A0A3D1JIU5_9CHLR|nr:ribonuclease HIII [Anaerolinea thermolimosa]
MNERLDAHLSAMEDLLRESGLQIVERRAISYGVQIVLTDGLSKVPLNFFTSGRITAQGRPSDLQVKLDAWAKQQEATFRGQAAEEERKSQANILVAAPAHFHKVRSLLADMPGVSFVSPRGSALFHAEIEKEHQHVAVTLYPSGTLVIQGLASRLLDEITQTLNVHVVKPLDWALVEGAPPTEDERYAVLEDGETSPALAWLQMHCDPQVLWFTRPSLFYTLVAAAQLREAWPRVNYPLAEARVLVLPFARALSGFLTQLALHLGWVEGDAFTVPPALDTLRGWWERLASALPDPQVQDTLAAAWQALCDALRPDFVLQPAPPLCPEDAEAQIAAVLKTITHFYHIWVASPNVPAASPPAPTGEADDHAEAWIGTDEAGKGDVFGPLVVAGVAVTAETLPQLQALGVRDSKVLDDAAILRLAGAIKALCPHEVLVLEPQTYNKLYPRHGRNLNRLLAWAHAQAIARLAQQTGITHALSDQFSTAHELETAVAQEAPGVHLRQFPQAERDPAVAAASILARAAFLEGLHALQQRFKGVSIPLGATDPQVRQAVRDIYERWAMDGLRAAAKCHFRTVTEALGNVPLHC